MKIRPGMLLTGLSVAGLLLVLAAGVAQRRGNRIKRDADDLVRWEDEGGPPELDEKGATANS
jgi:hypothetical protein